MSLIEKFKNLFTGKNKSQAITQEIVIKDPETMALISEGKKDISVGYRSTEVPEGEYKKEYKRVPTMDSRNDDGKEQGEIFISPAKKIKGMSIVKLLEDQAIMHKGEKGAVVPAGAKGMVMRCVAHESTVQVYFKDHKARVTCDRELLEVVEE